MILAGFDPLAHGLPAGSTLARDENAPELFAVWLEGGDDILGSGVSAYEALRDARATVRGWMFGRLRCLLAAFDRGEFDAVGLEERLGEYLARSPFVPNASRKRTVVGMPCCEVRP